MGLDISILYRGRLSGCNYDCGYCPFAKRIDDKDTLSQDATDLMRFVDWIETRKEDALRILFTPWGEALIRKSYQKALVHLSHLPQIKRVSIQTNLSCALGWIEALNPKTASLWCTYHPSEVSSDKFLEKCQILETAGIRYSVGIVGKKASFEKIAELKERLPEKAYLWVNAYKDDGPDYYNATDIDFLKSIDPHFTINLRNYDSFDRICRAGHESISIDGLGDIRRCHFIQNVIGNIHKENIEDILRPTRCSRKCCDCHIGYSNIPDLKLDDVFSGWALGRVI